MTSAVAALLPWEDARAAALLAAVAAPESTIIPQAASVGDGRWSPVRPLEALAAGAVVVVVVVAAVWSITSAPGTLEGETITRRRGQRITDVRR